MSEYRNFDRCIICRSRYNLKTYPKDFFEETLLINTLYMAVMFPIEMRQKKQTAKATITQYLYDHNLVDTHENDFKADDIVRCLRNAFAHFNLSVDSHNGVVSSIKLWAINRSNKPKCQSDKICDDPKYIPKLFKENSNGEICTFLFLMNELWEFTYFVINHALDRLSNDLCIGCTYEEDIR